MIIEFSANVKLNIKNRIWVTEEEKWMLTINHGNFVIA